MRFINADDFISKVTNWLEFHTIGFNKTYSSQDLEQIRVLQNVIDLAKNMAIEVPEPKEESKSGDSV